MRVVDSKVTAENKGDSKKKKVSFTSFHPQEVEITEEVKEPIDENSDSEEEQVLH